ncbi:MAG: hypothetical protein IJW18_04550 [Lachnospiraceae bacterium]|nr:hypothetical protein [Lachnospiraceae bacterium]
MDTRIDKIENNKVAFQYLTAMGIVNILVAAIKALERVADKLGPGLGKLVTGLLGFSEPYGKILASIALLVIFIWLAKKNEPSKGITLLTIWGIVFVGVQTYYYLEMIFYDRILEDYFELVSDGEVYAAFYAGTHGFKYAPMFVGIMFGIAMTGIMLKDKLVIICACVFSVLYLFFFGFQDMAFLSFRDTTVGIVLCSALFHIIQSVGILLLGIILKLKYRD